MPSSLTWIDHDAAARERSLRILAMFQEKESRDELGLGGIRDAFADRLFPGTSTIQTRLRYMLFVPWIYRALEERRVGPGDFARQADTIERDLIVAMRNADDREAGVFGGRSGRQLKRLPSSVYWAGLGSWGIRRTDVSQDRYHRGIGVVYRRRAEQALRERERSKNGDDSDRAPAHGTETWHPRLPPAPPDFPQAADFKLTAEEASFLLDRITLSHPDSLLAHLALRCEPAEVDAPWHHPELASFSEAHRELLDHASRFSEVMHGAALVYNIALARESIALAAHGGRQHQLEAHREALTRWASGLDLDALRGWSLPRLWDLTLNHGHTITPATRRFVEQWVGRVAVRPGEVGEDAQALGLVREREIALKRSRSRFRNRRALDQWQGSSGLGRMTYRWPTAATFLGDLSAALRPTPC